MTAETTQGDSAFVDASSAGSGQASSDPDREGVRRQLQTWREHLIDIGRGNPLLGINRSRTSKLRIIAPGAEKLFAALAVEEAKLRLPAIRKRENLPQFDPSAWLVREGDLTFDGDPSDIAKRIRRIRDNARTTVEERGVTTLHVTFGAVRWVDPLLGDSTAPIVLVPATLEKSGTDEGALLLPTDEDPIVNPALALYLRDRHKLALPSLPDELSVPALRELLEQVRRMVSYEWTVTDETWLSTFTFETLTIYQDLARMEDAAVSSPIVRAFSGLHVPLDRDASERLGDDLDAYPTPDQVPLPAVAADSSQLDALTYARRGQHVVVHGPPGTGKSQTITNLIADALGQGKTVLFVSAKMAALEVVHRRLADLGLDRFCLEAHSTKAGKARVIDALRSSLQHAAAVGAPDRLTNVQRYLDLRASLNNVVVQMHRKREPLGTSVYEGLGRFERLRAMPEVHSPLPWSDATKVTSGELQTALDRLADLRSLAPVFAARKTHPWRGYEGEDSSLANREAVVEALKTLSARSYGLMACLTDLGGLLGDPTDRTFADLEAAASALQLVTGCSWLPEGWTSVPDGELDEAALELRAAAEMTRRLREARHRFDEHTDGSELGEVTELLLSGLDRYGAWFKRMRPSYFAWRRQVFSTVRPRRGDFGTIAMLADAAMIVQEAGAWLASHSQAIARAVQARSTQPSESELEEAARAYEAASALRRVCLALDVDPEPIEVTALTSTMQDAAAQIAARLPSADESLHDSINVVDRLWHSGFVSSAVIEGSVAAARYRAEEAINTPERLAEWVLLKQALHRCAELGLGPFLAEIEPIGCDDAPEVFLRRFWLLWADFHITATPSLASFRGDRRTVLVSEFATLDEAIRRAVRGAAIASASIRAAQIGQTSVVARNSQVGILQRELQKQRPRPLRRLFAEIPQVLQAIKPCMLMSPLSVSTYLSPDLRFDLVVFDESSQIRPQEAIPSILRADQVVVAGDDKQLPPTAFFSSSLFALDDDGDEELEDAEPLESLLHECEAVAPLFQPVHLRWHYRSRDERLIAFSNNTFYDGSLITFPTPGSPVDAGVQLHYVASGQWDRGRSKTNRQEARKAAELVLQQLDARPERSIGVVAMNISQKEAIEDALAEALERRPDLKPLLATEGSEPFFVKSLENVQGDERDTIIVSIGYGPDLHGAVHLNFGPLNQEGGWRRLNVLVTRAKHLVALVTSLRSDQLHGVAPTNRGATALREFIAYAERGCRLPAEAAVVTQAETNDFEDAVAASLRVRGLAVDEQVGVSSYRIDLAIRDPRDPSWYVLGIECDGSHYHSSRTARDRDLLRADVLRGMGWKLHRIWSIDWFRNPDEEIDRAVRAVERAMGAGEPSGGVDAPVDGTPPLVPDLQLSIAEVDPEGFQSAPVSTGRYPGGVPYTRARRSRPDRRLLIDPRSRRWLTAELVRVVTEEQPIHAELLLQRLKELHRVGRAGSNVQANFNGAVHDAIRARTIQIDKDNFASVPGAMAMRFRVPSPGETARGIEHVPAAEMRLAILHVVDQQFGLPRDALIREVAREFGLRRTASDISDAIGTVVDNLIERGELRRAGLQIQLP